MYCFRTTVTTDKGDALVGWQLECVQNANLTTPVTIYSDENSTPIASVSGVSNRAVTDSAGNAYFFVEDGLYGIRYYDSQGVYKRTERYFSMFKDRFTDGLSVGNRSAFGYANDDLARIYKERGLPTGIQHTFRVITSSKGDNTTYRGATNAYFEWRDADDVTNLTKGVGYALHLSAVPRVGRNNVPYDDVACLTMGNTTGVTTAKGTDCMYVSQNPLFTAAGTSEWYSIFTADCKADIGYQVRFQPVTKKVARFPNDSYIYFNTATDLSLGSDRIGIGMFTDGALVLGDFSSPRADVRPPLNCVQGMKASGGSIGYSTGTGGTVTQATSKSTDVTLNKVCGQITMNGAALAANTSVSFTLTNSQIAATDIVIANIASGATASSYQLTVDQVSAGSCRIHLRNVSGGSLSEAVVLNIVVLKAVAA